MPAGRDTGSGEVPLGRVSAHPLEALLLADWSHDAWCGVELPSPWALPVFPGSRPRISTASRICSGFPTCHFLLLSSPSYLLQPPHLTSTSTSTRNDPSPSCPATSHYSGVSELSPPLSSTLTPAKGASPSVLPSPHRTAPQSSSRARVLRSPVAPTGLETQRARPRTMQGREATLWAHSPGALKQVPYFSKP